MSANTPKLGDTDAWITETADAKRTTVVTAHPAHLAILRAFEPDGGIITMQFNRGDELQWLIERLQVMRDDPLGASPGPEGRQ